MPSVESQFVINDIYFALRNFNPYIVFLEIFGGALLIWIIFSKTFKNDKKQLSATEIQGIIENWKPEPLITKVANDDPALNLKVVSGRVGKRITIDGVDCLNLGSTNFLGLVEDQNIIERAIKSIKKYGVGSCGPRGFYGTVDVHLELEERLAKYMKQEEAVVYSYAFSTIASAIPAYAKRRDIIFVDEAVNFAIQKGLDASRSKIIYFKHNDMQDLENKLIEHASCLKAGEKTRKFLIVEGIYLNTGEMCPLKDLVKLRKRFKLRMFLDESISFGCLGQGRGLLVHLGVDISEVDLISASLENSISSIGGFCVGSHFIVEHQRLSGLGYCFSASLPPLLAQAAISALDMFESDTLIFETLKNACELVHKKFLNFSNLTLRGHILSPIKHLYLSFNPPKAATEENKLLQKIVDKCIENRLALVKAEYLQELERSCPRPSIRIAVNRFLSEADINEAFNTLERISKSLMTATI